MPSAFTFERLRHCRSKQQCPLQNKWLTKSLVHQATVTSASGRQTYVGITEGTFKSRFNNHALSFRNSKYKYATELSKHLWSLKDAEIDYNISWAVLRTPTSCNSASKKCNLCLTEKYLIIIMQTTYVYAEKKIRDVFPLQTCYQAATISCDLSPQLNCCQALQLAVNM